MQAIQRFLREEDGAAMVEYGLIAGLIAVASVVVLGEIGTQINTIFGKVKDVLTKAAA